MAKFRTLKVAIFGKFLPFEDGDAHISENVAGFSPLFLNLFPILDVEHVFVLFFVLALFAEVSEHLIEDHQVYLDLCLERAAVIEVYSQFKAFQVVGIGFCEETCLQIEFGQQ